ncbi:hypothetical protein ACTZGP_13460, partial [Pseudomonas putida]|uniref:hypothetical protein n=1 Tax=Pseudomonas putida TaxID=303 RepID=UPI003FD340C9
RGAGDSGVRGMTAKESLSDTPPSPVGRACSRKRRISQHLYRMTHRIREQARSHKMTGNLDTVVRAIQESGA